MNLLNTLTIKNLKLNKKRTIVTIVGIILSVALITAVASMYDSLASSLISYETAVKGNYHYAYYDVDSKDVVTFKNNKSIESINITQGLGYASIESKNEYKPYIYVMEFNKESLDNLAIRLLDGRLPVNEDEVLIPSHLKTNGRVFYNIGDDITLDIGNRVLDDYSLGQNNPFNHEDEKIINTKTKTFKIVGIIERPPVSIEPYTAPGYTLITYLDDNVTGNVNLYTRYTKKGLKNQYEVTANILDVNPEAFEYVNTFSGYALGNEKLDKAIEEISNAKYEIDVNEYLIMLETNPIKESSIGGLGIVVLIVCIIIIITSVFCIKNSFDISISEKTKQYGMLKSIGATKKQIRKNVLYEATILGLIGIPLGIISGNLATFILIKISNYYLGSLIAYEFNLVYKISYIAIIISIILGIITIYLSAVRSASKASKISPIKSITNSEDIKIKKKIKTPKLISKIFGIGGEISYKNIKRNKKKYRTTVISIIVSVMIFVSLSYIMDLLYDGIQKEIGVSDYNISLIVSPKGNQELYNKTMSTIKLDGIKRYTLRREYRPALYDARCNPEYQKRIMDCPKNGFDNSPVFIISVGDRTYNEYIEKLGLKYDEIKDKGILVDFYNYTKYDDSGKMISSEMIRKYTYNIGDNITFSDDYDKINIFDIKVGYITQELPFGISSKELNPHLIVSDEYMDNYKYANYGLVLYFDSEDPNKLQDEIEEILKDENYALSNINEEANKINNFLTLIAIFLYGFITVISLIGITNIFNTITTSMELRKREFATLKSIGMTNKEFNRMIRLESLFLGLKSLIIGISLGIIISYVTYKLFTIDNMAYNDNYRLPYIPILICILAVFILITSLMKYSLNKISRQNTIETIRNENI